MIEIHIPKSKCRVFIHEPSQKLYELTYEGYEELPFEVSLTKPWLYTLSDGTVRDASVDLCRGFTIDDE